MAGLEGSVIQLLSDPVAHIAEEKETTCDE